MSDHIRLEMTIDEILTKFPNKAQKIALRLTQAGLHCVGCGAATWETLANGMSAHGLPQDERDKLLEDLNKVVDEETDPENVTLTPRAAKKFLEFLENENKQGWGLRFGEKKAGCSGLEYILEFSKEAEEDDRVFTSHNIQIHVKEDLITRLIGSEIDYIDGLQGAGFKVSNPNVTSACGCGTSHNYRKKATSKA